MREPSGQLEEIVNAVPLGVVVLDGNLKVLLANAAAHTHLTHLGEPPAGGPLRELGGQPLAQVLDAPAGERVEVQGGGAHL